MDGRPVTHSLFRACHALQIRMEMEKECIVYRQGETDENEKKK